MPSCPPPRLCQMTKWDHFDGYGFNLHADKNRSGQFVGLIDPGSPAEASGLREGDRIVEVNGVNVTHDNHKHVVVRIKSNPSSTTMLVCDKDCDAYHREHGLIVTSCLPYILKLSSEDEDTLDTRHKIDGDDMDRSEENCDYRNTHHGHLMNTTQNRQSMSKEKVTHKIALIS